MNMKMAIIFTNGIADVNEEMKITYEETFGPVAPLIRFSTEDEVVEKANHIEYGLASYFYTNDLQEHTEFQRNLTMEW